VRRQGGLRPRDDGPMVAIGIGIAQEAMLMTMRRKRRRKGCGGAGSRKRDDPPRGRRETRPCCCCVAMMTTTAAGRDCDPGDDVARMVHGAGRMIGLPCSASTPVDRFFRFFSFCSLLGGGLVGLAWFLGVTIYIRTILYYSTYEWRQFHFSGR
jgi:hypothetical protein